jgi:hypothetical protein
MVIAGKPRYRREQKRPAHIRYHCLSAGISPSKKETLTSVRVANLSGPRKTQKIPPNAALRGRCEPAAFA